MKPRNIAFVVAITLAATGAVAEQQPNPQHLKRAASLTQKANNALKAGNLEKAGQLFRKAIEVVPRFPDAHLGLGHVAMRERRFEDALSAYRRASEDYGWFGGSLFINQQDAYFDAQDRLDQLRGTLARLEQTGVNSGQNAVQNQRQIQKVRAEIFRLESIKMPDDPAGSGAPGQLHFYIGNALANLNRPTEAVAEWETCAREEPKFAPVYNNLAVAYWKIGRLDDAVASLETAEALGLAVHPQLKADLLEAASQARLASSSAND